MKLRALLLLAALLAAVPVQAQVPNRDAEIDKIFEWVKPGMPGCAVAASQRGKVVVNRAYGLADLERNVPLTPDSVFDVASIRKQFVAAAILLLVEEKRLSLSDDVRKHIPELPDYGHTITLDHMLTHTSGLRDWIPLRNFANRSDDAMTMILRQRGVNFAPGTEWSYSNTGYVLLTEIVARIAKTSFAEFARTRLFEPLGMKATVYVDDLRQVIKNRALAYEKAGSGWRMDMLLDNDRGGGGALFSTASDLLIWNDALTNARLGQFVSDKLEEPATLNDGTKLDYARGLMLETNHAGRVLFHGGGAAAYRSVLGRFPESGMSIAILCNAGESADKRTMFAGRILDLFVTATGKRPEKPAAPPVASKPAAPRPEPPVLSAEQLQAFAGRYESDELLATFDITAAAKGLMVKLNDRPAVPFVPFAADTFQLGGMTLRFTRDSGGRITAVDLTNPVLRNVRFLRVDRAGGR